MRRIPIVLAYFLCLCGCASHQVPEVRFCNDVQEIGLFGEATDGVEYPDVERCGLDGDTVSLAPRTIADGEPTEFWDLTFADAVQIALQNSSVLRDLGARVLDSPQILPTVFDPAIAQSHPRLGEEAALSAFDAQLAQSFIYSDSDLPFNNSTKGGGAFEVQGDEYRWNSRLTKTAATGGQFGLQAFTNHDHNDAPSNLFSHAWTNGLEATLRQPLLQGAGIAFNRIAGPNAHTDLTLSPGVVLARINTDIAVTDFERGVRDFVDRVETAYWQLYSSYRILEAKRLARDTSRETWRSVKSRYDAGLPGGEADQEAQAREQLYSFEQQVLVALDGEPLGAFGSEPGGVMAQLGVYPSERRLRQLMGLPVNDGRLIRPYDEPTEAPVQFNWDGSLLDGLARRVELRKQLWTIKRRELELLAAKNFLLPRLDAVASFRTEGLGDDLFGRTASFESAVNELFSFQHHELVAGLQLDVPIGYRREIAGVRHAELNLCRARAVLREQEQAVAHELGGAIAAVITSHQNIELTYNRTLAAEQVVAARTVAFEAGRVAIETLLEAQRRLAEARTEYFDARVNHVLAIKNVHRSKGTLLPYNGIYLSEADSCAPAYAPARQRKRFHNRLIDYRFTKPCNISLGPFDTTIDSAGAGTVKSPTPESSAELMLESNELHLESAPPNLQPTPQHTTPQLSDDLDEHPTTTASIRCAFAAFE